MTSKADEYWFKIVNDVASNSKCLSIKVGAIIVKDHRYVISTGYNGPPAGCVHCDDKNYREHLVATYCNDIHTHFDGHIVGDDILVCPRQIMGFKSSEGIQYCQAAHAERNAIDIAAKLGHTIDGCTIYITRNSVCIECAKSIINAGIKEIVVLNPYVDYEKIGLTGRFLLNQAGVHIRSYDC